MALQVRPGLANSDVCTGLHESAKVIRSRPAYSIRASDHESHTKAECMAAISTCNTEPESALGNWGRPCMHAPNRRARVAISALAPQVRRKGADVGRWATFRAHPNCGKMSLSRR
jgi:hypothetical protein